MAQPGWEPRFLDAFRNAGNVRVACQAAGVSRNTPYARARDDPEFKAAWDQAREDAVDLLDAIAWKRAQDNSDYLLWKLLQAHRRSVYGDKLEVDARAHVTATVEVGELSVDRMAMIVAVLGDIGQLPAGVNLDGAD